MNTPKPTANAPRKDDSPQRNLPGMVTDPNRPTEPTHREFEPSTPAPAPPSPSPASPSPSPQTPEFQHEERHEVEQPRMGGDPKGLV
jgi:hypothetical protein